MILHIEQQLIDVIKYFRSNHPNIKLFITEIKENKQNIEYLIQIIYPYKGNEIWSFKTIISLDNTTSIREQLKTFIENVIDYKTKSQTQSYVEYI